MSEIEELKKEIRLLRKAVEDSGPQCNCGGPLALKKLGWDHSLEWDCPKHGNQYRV